MYPLVELIVYNIRCSRVLLVCQSAETMRQEFRDSYMRSPMEAVQVVIPK